MKIEVVRALPAKASVVTVQLDEGATVAEAIAASGLTGTAFGIFGKSVPAGHRLRDGDRVEIYRPLKMDPKEARRRRARR